jgi:hypothetical protein
LTLQKDSGFVRHVSVMALLMLQMGLRCMLYGLVQRWCSQNISPIFSAASICVSLMEPYFQTFPPPKRSVSFSHDGHLQEFEVDPGTEKRDFRYYDPNVSYATHCEPCQSDEDDVVLMPSRNRELEEISLRFDDAEKMDIVDEEGSQDTEGS